MVHDSRSTADDARARPLVPAWVKALLRATLPPGGREALKRAYVRVLASLCSSNLNRLALLHGTDKWGHHWYTSHYMDHFRARRRSSLTLLELGVGGYEDALAGGNSLRMWRDYFPNARVYGIDVHLKPHASERRIKVFQGSQEDEVFLRRVISEIGPPDIVIDDASHVSEYTIRSFEILFPLLRPGGVYAIEDTSASYSTGWGGSDDLGASHTTLGFAKRLTDHTNWQALRKLGLQIPAPRWALVSVHFYEGLVIICKA